MSVPGWETWTSDMFVDLEKFPPLSQGIQVTGQVVQAGRLQNLPWLGHSSLFESFFLYPFWKSLIYWGLLEW